MKIKQQYSISKQTGASEKYLEGVRLAKKLKLEIDSELTATDSNVIWVNDKPVYIHQLQHELTFYSAKSNHVLRSMLADFMALDFKKFIHKYRKELIIQ